MAEKEGEDGVVGHPQPAVDLEGAVDHHLHGAGDNELDHRDVLARLLPPEPLDLPGGVQGEHPRRLDIGVALGDPGPHDVLVG